MSKFWVIFIHCVKSPKIFCVRSANGKERKERKCFSAKVVYYLLCKLLDSDLEKENTKKDFFAFRYFSTTFQIAFFSCNILHALHMQSARLKSFHNLTLLIHQIRWNGESIIGKYAKLLFVFMEATDCDTVFENHPKCRIWNFGIFRQFLTY